MNTLDIVILLLFIPGMVRGISKGFLEQIISLAGIVASVWLAYKFSTLVAGYIKNYLTVSDAVLNVISYVVIILTTLLLVIIIAKIATKVADMASLGWLNRLLGFVFSICTSAVVIGLLVIIFDTINQRFQLVTSPVLQDSVLYGHLKDLGDLVFPYLKQLPKLFP